MSSVYSAQQHFVTGEVFLTVGEAYAVLETAPTAAKATIVAIKADRSRFMGSLSINSYKV